MTDANRTDSQRTIARSLDALLIVSAMILGLSVIFLANGPRYDLPVLLGIA